jgi:two-component system sensor histidine kinase HydH
MPKSELAILRIGLFALLGAVTAAAILVTFEFTRSAKTLAGQALASTALSLSYSAENALRLGAEAGEGIRSVFSDRVVAYALLASEKGRILFHTNRRLEGQQLSAEELSHWSPAEAYSSRRVRLGTGMPAQEFDFTIHAPEEGRRYLRLVLHTASADRIAAAADRLWWILFGAVLFLWTIGILLERTFTRYRRLRDRMEREERLALIGQMTAVLAHEIRNAVGGIKGFSQWMGERTADGDERKAAVEGMIRGTDRIESLVNDLLLYSRDEVYDIRDIELRPLLDEALEPFRSHWRGRIERQDTEGLRVRADREKLERILTNGIRNALEAMGDDGVLRIDTRTEGGRVVIGIADAGQGIRTQDKARLFTPFFTTKTGGTGLGLAYSRKVVEGMGGSIQLANRGDGAGAVLTIRLPGGE